MFKNNEEMSKTMYIGTKSDEKIGELVSEGKDSLEEFTKSCFSFFFAESVSEARHMANTLGLKNFAAISKKVHFVKQKK